jgi:hypothetical protein
MKSFIDSEVQEMVTSEVVEQEKADVKKPQKKKTHKKKKGHKKGKKKTAPKSNTLVAQKGPAKKFTLDEKLDHLGITKKSSDFDSKSQPVVVPIDEVNAITLKISPTFERDKVESVTLKSFRKVIGYDTFDAIRKGDRDEVKDPSDHYNVTMSLMVQRIPEAYSAAPSRDPYASANANLAAKLDKGFPYDDGDNQFDDKAPRFLKKPTEQPRTVVGKLNG